MYVAGMADQLSETYQDLLTGNYDCVDRIVLNAYFRPGHSGGGFRVWWQKLTGTIDTLDNAHLMRLSGRFSRRVRAWAKGSGIPLIDCSPGERKHDIAEEHLKKTTVKQGVFLILVARAQAPVWDVGPKHRLERKKPMPYVNHYSFHILDPDWGHVTIKISGHPPFPAQVILNGHEYVACQARKAGIQFTKEGNCFTQISDAAGLAKIADTLSAEMAIGRLSQGLRALDLQRLPWFCSRFRRTQPKRFPLSILQLSDGIQPQLDLRDRPQDGSSVSGAD